MGSKRATQPTSRTGNGKAATSSERLQSAKAGAARHPQFKMSSASARSMRDLRNGANHGLFMQLSLPFGRRGDQLVELTVQNIQLTVAQNSSGGINVTQLLHRRDLRCRPAVVTG